MTDIDADRSRIRALLGFSDDSDVEEGDAHPVGAELGAAGAVGFRWPGNAAAVNVYVFGDYWGADSAEATLLKSIDRDAVAVQSTVNGGLLLWATAPADDDAARARIKGLASRFAGQE
jgi:hypothetical protein